MKKQKTIDKFQALCCQHGVTLVLDAQTEDRELRLTSLEKEFQCVMQDFQEWIRENSIKPQDVWYADLFRAEGDRTLKHVASLFVEVDGVSVRMEPAPKDSKITAFKRKPGIRRRFRNFKAQFSKEEIQKYFRKTE